MSSITTIDPEADGYYYPTEENQIVQLVLRARQDNLQIRVRGASHSTPQAIYTDPCNGEYIDTNASAPEGSNINIKLSRYTEVLVSTVPGENVVTVQAGIHIGYDRNDPLSTPENSLASVLEKRGLAIPETGGISHQTISGFLSTGSAGGSTQYDAKDSVHAMRFIDGTGGIYEVSCDDTNPDAFNAALVSMGLLGIMSTVTLKCVPAFNIQGIQTCTLMSDSVVDILSDNPTDGREGLTSFYTGQEYARIMWWPQKSDFLGIQEQRLQVWRANRIEPTADFEPKPFQLFASAHLLILYSYAILLTGNITNLDVIATEMEKKEPRFTDLMVEELMEKDPTLTRTDAEEKTVEIINAYKNIMSFITNFMASTKIIVRKVFLPALTAICVSVFAPLDPPDGATAARSENNELFPPQPIEFQDTWFHGLPMDMTADDVVIPVSFGEFWVPFSKATEFTNLVYNHFAQDDPHKALANTGNNAWEIYCTPKSDAWLSMSYSDGVDVWSEGVMKLNPNWYVGVGGDQRDLYGKIWDLLRDNNIPFRMHWGKVLMEDLSDWGSFVRAQYPKMDAFLSVRAERDPDGIFLTDYWRGWLGV